MVFTLVFAGRDCVRRLMCSCLEVARAQAGSADRPINDLAALAHPKNRVVSGTRQCVLLVAVISLFTAALPVTIFAQEPVPQAAPVPVPDESRKAAFAKFLAGAAVGVGLHEAGHLAAGWKRYDVSRRRAIAATSAGFWAQYLTSETVLTRHPHLRSDYSPFLKGVIAFHLVTSAGYSVLAMTRSGPHGRDTLDMSRAIGVNERWIGALVLAPAVVDGIRYLRPEARWAKWLSRGIKLGSVAVVYGKMQRVHATSDE